MRQDWFVSMFFAIGRGYTIFVEGIRSNPSRHKHHGHPGPWVGRASREIQGFKIRASVGRLECPENLTMACQTIDCPIKNMIAIVNILRSKGCFKANVLLQILQSLLLQQQPRCEKAFPYWQQPN